MLNYDKMDSVLQNLDDCVENMKNVSETQEKLEEFISRLDDMCSNMRNLQGAIDTQAEKILTNTLKEIDEVLLDLKPYCRIIRRFTPRLKSLNWN